LGKEACHELVSELAKTAESKIAMTIKMDVYNKRVALVMKFCGHLKP